MTNTSRRRGDADASDRGSTLVLAMVVMACVLAAGAGLLTLSAANRAMSANFGVAARAGCAADAIAAYAVAALRSGGRWGAAVQPGGQAPFAESSLLVWTSWQRTVNLANETADLQRRTNGRWARGADTPVWHLFAWGSLDALIEREPHGGSPYLVAWVADNPADGDGDPGFDSDGVLVVRAEARHGRLMRAVELFVKRDPSNTSVSPDAAAATDGGTGTASDGLAQILPESDGGTDTNATGVRVLSWRDVP